MQNYSIFLIALICIMTSCNTSPKDSSSNFVSSVVEIQKEYKSSISENNQILSESKDTDAASSNDPGNSSEEEIELTPEEQEAKEIMIELLTRAKTCEELCFTKFFGYEEEELEIEGFVPIDYSRTSVDLRIFRSIEDIKSYIFNTFEKSLAQRICDRIDEFNLYGEFNGELYMHGIGGGFTTSSLLWDKDSIVVLEYTPDKIIIKINTSNVFMEEWQQKLIAILQDGKWVLTDSYEDKFELQDGKWVRTIS